MRFAVMRCAGCTFLQLLDLGITQVTPFANLDAAKRQCIQLCTDQALNGIAERIPNPSYLPLTTFAHRDANPGHVFIAGQHLEVNGFSWAIVQHDAAPPDVQGRIGHVTDQRHLIDFRMFVARMRQFLRQFAVIGQQHQTFAIGI